MDPAGVWDSELVEMSNPKAGTFVLSMIDKTEGVDGDMSNSAGPWIAGGKEGTVVDGVSAIKRGVAADGYLHESDPTAGMDREEGMEGRAGDWS